MAKKKRQYRARKQNAAWHALQNEALKVNALASTGNVVYDFNAALQQQGQG